MLEGIVFACLDDVKLHWYRALLLLLLIGLDVMDMMCHLLLYPCDVWWSRPICDGSRPCINTTTIQAYEVARPAVYT